MRSESSFVYRIHSNPDWVGLCGINTPVWRNLPFNPYIDSGNIWSAAYILKYYLDLSNGNYEDALTRYKGYSSYGRRLAIMVLAIKPQRNINDTF